MLGKEGGGRGGGGGAEGGGGGVGIVPVVIVLRNPSGEGRPIVSDVVVNQ